MRKLTPFFSQFLSTDRGLSVLTGFLFINIFVLVPLSEFDVIRTFIVSDVLYFLILVSGVMAVAKSRIITLVAAGFALVTLVVHLANIFVPGVGLASLNAFLSLVFLGMLAVMVLLQVFREGPITMHRIMGAISVYLLLGLMWAFAYELVELQKPGSFHLVALPTGGVVLLSKLIYFSFITLTTVGYGDITAVHPVARSLAMLEAVTGQLFLVITIAQLVSMELYYRQMGKMKKP